MLAAACGFRHFVRINKWTRCIVEETLTPELATWFFAPSLSIPASVVVLADSDNPRSAFRDIFSPSLEGAGDRARLEHALQKLLRSK